MASPLISGGEVEWITSGISFNCRNDGRTRDEYRPLEVGSAFPQPCLTARDKVSGSVHNTSLSISSSMERCTKT